MDSSQTMVKEIRSCLEANATEEGIGSFRFRPLSWGFLWIVIQNHYFLSRTERSTELTFRNSILVTRYDMAPYQETVGGIFSF
jgi:hypothetical protein